MKQQMTWLLVAAIVTVFPLHALAQFDNWTSVRAIPKGVELIIERKNSDRVIGYLQAATEDSLAVTSDEGSFIIEKDKVTKVYHAVARDKKKSMNRGALYGMLAGLAAGIAIAKVHEPKNEEMPWVGTFFGGLGIGTWAGIRHAKGKDKGPLIYSAK